MDFMQASSLAYIPMLVQGHALDFQAAEVTRREMLRPLQILVLTFSNTTTAMLHLVTGLWIATLP